MSSERVTAPHKKKPVLFFAERVTQEPLDFVGLSNNIQPYKYPLSLPLPPPRQQRRAAPRSARSLFRRTNSSERASAGAAGTTSITTAGGFTRGKAIHRNSHNSTRVR